MKFQVLRECFLRAMDTNTILCALCGILMAATSISGVNTQACRPAEVWNPDIDECIPCSSCQQYPKTPSCEKCTRVHPGPSDAWRLAAITSLSVLATVLVFGGLVIGVLVLKCRTKRSTLREPIEETTGPLYPL
ncbi:uncharacterized protein LOC143137957 [Alosa pseudoharengus]|uniref:tumor necrosis factor receptor superfamily member 12A n=1 Tax=Alosa sapidissima TaxID=34773 RepID=UPI001C08B7C5|nr:tumor necrosis factor receptor superfamily member 12A [Alosa sapidissima]